MRIRTHVVKIGFGAAAIVLGVAAGQSAQAAGMAIDPQCAGMAEPVACTCALQNGGTVRPSHGEMRWYGPRGSQDATNKCMRAAGGAKQ
jgi:hypothetical protein